MEFDGIILRSTPLKEKDAMITALTSDKIISFYARGVLSIKSKNSPALSTFTHSRISLNEGPQGGLTLKEATILRSYPNVITKFEDLAILNYIAEFSLKCIDENDAKDLYNYLLNSLELLENNFDEMTLLNIYIAHSLNYMGIGLDVDECVFCHNKKDIVTISFEDGGFICQNCFDSDYNKKETERYLKIYRYIFKVNFDQLNRVAFNKEENFRIFNKLNNYIEEQTGARIQAVDLINKI